MWVDLTVPTATRRLYVSHHIGSRGGVGHPLLPSTPKKTIYTSSCHQTHFCPGKENHKNPLRVELRLKPRWCSTDPLLHLGTALLRSEWSPFLNQSTLQRLLLILILIIVCMFAFTVNFVSSLFTLYYASCIWQLLLKNFMITIMMFCKGDGERSMKKGEEGKGGVEEVKEKEEDLERKKG